MQYLLPSTAMSIFRNKTVSKYHFQSVMSKFYAVSPFPAGAVARGIIGVHSSIIVVTCTCVAITYTLVGGLRAVVYTDVLQVVLLLIGLVRIRIRNTCACCSNIEGLSYLLECNTGLAYRYQSSALVAT